MRARGQYAWCDIEITMRPPGTRAKGQSARRLWREKRCEDFSDVSPRRRWPRGPGGIRDASNRKG